MENQRNLMIAIALAVGIMLVFQLFVTGPEAERRAAAREEAAVRQAEAATIVSAEPVMRSVEDLRAETGRIDIDNARLRGSLSLSGARIDDIFLKDHFVSVEAKESGAPGGQVELLRPRGADGAFYAALGWGDASGGAGGDAPADLPGLDTLWTQVEGTNLTPDTPVVLEYETGGLTFQRRISVDDGYMFTVEQTVSNDGAAPVTLAAYGQVRRHGLPEGFQANMMVHEGGVGVAGGRLGLRKYRKLEEGETRELVGEEPGGWAAITDKYWLAAVIPDQGSTVTVRERALTPGDTTIFESSFQAQPVTVAPGQSVSATARIFAGAKEYDVLQNYQDDLGIDRFSDAIDWGNFWFLTHPYFWALEHIDSLVGNFGVAILIMVVFVKILLFPIANRAYASMAKMKKLQPRMKELQEKHKEDRERLQKEMMELYRTEKFNPVGGCLPVFLQIPVFFALYKTIFVTIEMRHEPFFGWVKDLSAPDPAMVGNLFGLIPWDPAAVTAIPLLGGFIFAIISIGVWPIVMGFTMWLLQSLNPPPPDPMQARIIGLMPIFFTFILGAFAVGLVIYWAWNNTLSIVQQYVIMRRHGVETQFDKLIARLRGRPPETEG
jgi:YidC/Oxa1 family membrane protein insertase